MCAGWPRQVTVAASTEGASGCLITGSALSGVFCNVPFSCPSPSQTASPTPGASSRIDPLRQTRC